MAASLETEIKSSESTVSITSQSDDSKNLSTHDGLENQKRELTGFRWAIVVLSVLSSVFLAGLDGTIVANVRPSIIDTFGHAYMLPWITVAYPVGTLGVIPLWGKLNGYFNQKILYLTAVLLFEVGSTIVGASQNMPMLIMGRTLAGIGNSGIYVGTMNILSAMTIASERSQYLNYVGISRSLGTFLGPVVGGALADSSATWRWAFYLNPCTAALTTLFCVWLIPQPKPKVTASNLTISDRVKRIDYIGAILFCAGSLTTVMILSFGGSVYSWHSGPMIGLYVATTTIWLLFTAQQRWSIATKDIIFPTHFVSQWEMVNLFSWTALSAANLFVTIYTLPLLYQFVFGLSSLRAALYTLPFISTALCTAAITGLIFARRPRYIVFFITSSILMLIGSALMTTIDHYTTLSTICGYSVIQGVGAGIVAQIVFTIAQVKNSKARQSEVTSFLSCAQLSGIVLSLGISTCVFVNVATDGLVPVLPGLSREMVQGAINGLGDEYLKRLSPVILQRVAEVIAGASARLFYLNVAGAGLGLLTALMMSRETLVLEDKL